MSKLVKNTLALLVLIAGILIAFLWYMGALATYEVRTEIAGPYNLVYEDYTGPYVESGAVFDRVYNNLMEDGIETTIGMGLYYDDPSEVDQSELRSKLGSVVSDSQSLELSDEYNVLVIEETEYAVVEFPYKNMLSYMIGPMVAYPVLEEYFGSDESSAEYAIEMYMEDEIYFMIAK